LTSFFLSHTLGFVHFCASPAGRKALRRNFNSQEGMFKPILRIKITPEGFPIQQSGHKNVQSRDILNKKREFRKFYRTRIKFLKLDFTHRSYRCEPNESNGL